MILICTNCFLCWSFWGNVFLNLIAIGGCCGLLLLIWKGLCWLDSWRWGKKHYGQRTVRCPAMPASTTIGA